jgi:hypothetical protein
VRGFVDLAAVERVDQMVEVARDHVGLCCGWQGLSRSKYGGL